MHRRTFTHKPHLLGSLLIAVFCLSSAAHAQQPAYTPQQVSPRVGASYVLPDGSIQIVTYSEMTGVIEALDALFVQTHPNVKFKVVAGDNYSGMASLTFDTTAFAPLGTEFTRIGLGDNLKIAPEPTAFRIAHASLQAGTKLSPLAIIVNKSNPLDHLTLDQMTRIFAVGGPGGDITQWSQLDIRGDLAEQEIVPCGLPGSDYFRSDDPQAGEFLSLRKMNGLNLNHTYEQYTHYDDVVKRVSEDASSIGITTLSHLSPAVKVVAVAATRTGIPYTGTADDIQAGRYPLDRYLYIYLRSNTGMQFDPFAKEYMRMVLSPQGQQVIAAEAHGYVPLNAREMADELAKLDQ